MRPIETIFNYIFLLRPTLLIPVWTIFLLGNYHAGHTDFWKTIMPTGFFFTLLVGSLYIFNQLNDRDSDKLNNKLFLISHGIVPVQQALYFSVAIAGVSLIYAFFKSWTLGLVFGLSLITGVLYNVRPFLFKNQAIPALLLNIIGHGFLTFAAGWSTANQSFSRELFLYSMPYNLGVGAIYLCTTIPDVEGDRLTLKQTMPVRYGYGLTVRLAIILILGMFTSIFYFRQGAEVVFLPTLCCTYFFIRLLLKPTKREALRTAKLGVLFLTIAAFWRYWWYGLYIVVVFFGSKWFYKKRFNLNFPSFKNE